MLSNKNGVAINCPTAEAYMEIVRVLDEHGFRYNTGKSSVNEDVGWGEYGKDFCFYARNNRIHYGQSIVQNQCCGTDTQMYVL